jgi:hypothetical protein
VSRPEEIGAKSIAQIEVLSWKALMIIAEAPCLSKQPSDVAAKKSASPAPGRMVMKSPAAEKK